MIFSVYNVVIILCGSGNSHDFIIILSFLYEISRINKEHDYWGYFIAI